LAEPVGQVAIVTGGGSGIGRATALKLAAAGYRVLVVGRRASSLEATVRLVRELPGAAIPCVTDLIDSDAPQRATKACLDEWGRIDILVNNVGVGGGGAVRDTTDTDWERCMAVNLKTAFRMIRSAVPAMVLNGAGAIVNVASGLALTGSQGNSAYSAAKSATLGLTRQAAAEYGYRGIRVNAVAPGATETPFTQGRIRSGKFRRVVESTPLGRLAQVHEIAAAVVFLSGPDSSFITGQILAVDGGWSSAH
jgi:NAD(P)-dependent dehydrogenase (short-subunit alcohol dehydrogenase family)